MYVTHDERELRLRVRQMRWEAEGVLSVVFESLDGSQLPSWSPGAHIDLHLPGVITRQYSLCGSPADSTRWRIAVLREPDSRGGSAAVHGVMRPGDVVDVVGPRNNFELDSSPSYLFVAGGIGITPLVPMMEQAEATGSPWRLVYGGRSRASMAFVDELQDRYGDRISVVPEEQHGRLDLESLLSEPEEKTLVYCCGPEPLLGAVESWCQSWPRNALHVERFWAKPQVQIDSSEEIEFEVVLAQTGTTVTVPVGMSVLEALEANGIEADHSCREGICGTCETAVLEGVPDHRDSLLDDDERAANDTMMICVGRSLCPRLVLDK